MRHRVTEDVIIEQFIDWYQRIWHRAPVRVVEVRVPVSVWWRLTLAVAQRRGFDPYGPWQLMIEGARVEPACPRSGVVDIITAEPTDR